MRGMHLRGMRMRSMLAMAGWTRRTGLLLLASACGCHVASTPSPSGAPAVPWPVAVPAGAAFRFAVYGDTRDGHEAHREIVRLVHSSRPDLVLQTGDLVSDSSVAGQWSVFEDITRQMRSASAYYPARGNHDNQGGSYFDGYVPTEGVHREGFQYSFDKGGVHFVAVDTEEEIIEKSPSYLWLDVDMAKARAAGLVIIPFYHKAIYSVGPHAMQRDVWTLRPVLHDLFRRHGVRLVFQGHDHLYYRTLRDGIVYVVTGGGGAPLYTERYPELRVPGDVSETSHHFCLADVFAERIDVTAYRRDRSVLDAFTVQSAAGPASQPAAAP